MPQLTTLEDFYLHKMDWLPDNLRQNIGHFNVLRLADFVGPNATRMTYSRKDFYKITLVSGRRNYYFADKTIELCGNALFLPTPWCPTIGSRSTKTRRACSASSPRPFCTGS